MICLRCGYCCKRLCVIIVDDPAKGLAERNLIVHRGDGTACKHLTGNRPGEYRCSIHDKPWYRKTPCFHHGQIEPSGNTECRMGRHLLDKLKEPKDAD